MDPGVSIISVAVAKKNSSNMYVISQPCSCKLQFLVIDQHCVHSDVMVGFKCNLYLTETVVYCLALLSWKILEKSYSSFLFFLVIFACPSFKICCMFFLAVGSE